MNEQEAKDLEDLKTEIQKIKIGQFDYLVYLDRYTNQELEMSGYRNMTNAEAMKKSFQGALQRIKKLTDEYLKKYPD